MAAGFCTIMSMKQDELPRVETQAAAQSCGKSARARNRKRLPQAEHHPGRHTQALKEKVVRPGELRRWSSHADSFFAARTCE
jgi:hypothetical protein